MVLIGADNSNNEKFDNNWVKDTHKNLATKCTDPIQDGPFRGCSRMGKQKDLPSLKSVTHFLQ